jgi:hypothetical protein
MTTTTATETALAELAERRAWVERMSMELRADTETAIRNAPPELSNYRMAQILGISRVHVARLRQS